MTGQSTAASEPVWVPEKRGQKVPNPQRRVIEPIPILSAVNLYDNVGTHSPDAIDPYYPSIHRRNIALSWNHK